MKTFVLVAMMALASNCTTTNPVGGDENVNVRTLNSGAYASINDVDPNALVATDEKTYTQIWQSMIGGGTPPAVDFENESVVFLFGGQRPTGGWSVEPKGIAIDGDAFVIDAKIRSPSRGAIVTQVITQPYAVIAVSSKAARRVRWDRAPVDRDRSRVQ